ncbi:hypothetical protein T4C_13633, partial [Trichinella pseudospiralis]
LDVTAVLRQTSHSKNCPVDEDIAYQMENRAMLKKRSAEEAKTMPQIYDEEAAAANAEPPTSGQFLFFREVRSAMYKQRANRFPRLPRDRQDLVLAPEFTRTKSGKAFLLTQSASQSTSWSSRPPITLDCWQHENLGHGWYI